MRMVRFSRAGALIALVAIGLVACSKGSSGPTEPVPSALLGSWRVVTLNAQGENLAEQGMNLSFHFSEQWEYSFLVTGDLLGLCDQGPSCSDWGEFRLSATHITFDPGEATQTFAYAIVGDTMTLTGMLNGAQVELTLERS